MSTVYEITSADAITGNPNSIAIVAPDGIHFIKGGCAEESRLWFDILRLFSQTNVKTSRKDMCVGGRAKRSATFPGIRNLGGGGAQNGCKGRLEEMKKKQQVYIVLM